MPARFTLLIVKYDMIYNRSDIVELLNCMLH